MELITLDVKEFCHECPSFHPEVTRLYGDDKLICQTITCNRKEECENLENIVRAMLNLKEQLKEKENASSDS